MEAFEKMQFTKWVLLETPTHIYIYGQTANEDPRKSEFESQRILNVEGGLS